MAWWGWLLIGLVVVVIPVKLRIWSKMRQKKAEQQAQMQEEDF